MSSKDAEKPSPGRRVLVWPRPDCSGRWRRASAALTAPARRGCTPPEDQRVSVVAGRCGCASVCQPKDVPVVGNRRRPRSPGVAPCGCVHLAVIEFRAECVTCGRAWADVVVLPSSGSIGEKREVRASCVCGAEDAVPAACDATKPSAGDHAAPGPRADGDRAAGGVQLFGLSDAQVRSSRGRTAVAVLLGTQSPNLVSGPCSASLGAWCSSRRTSWRAPTPSRGGQRATRLCASLPVSATGWGGGTLHRWQPVDALLVVALVAAGSLWLLRDGPVSNGQRTEISSDSAERAR
jgi:hypothetical protein